MSTPSHPSVTPERIQQFAWGYAPPLIIEAALKHGVFDLLAEGVDTVDAVAARSGASVRGLRSIMNALVGLQLLTKDANGRYGLAPDTAAFLVRGRPGFLGGLIGHTSSQLLPKWLTLGEVVRTGRPAHSVNQEQTGTAFFHDFVEDLFPMGYMAAQRLAEVLRVADATRPVRVLDLAAGSGVWGIALAQRSPQVRVTAVDWPGVLDVTRRVAARFGLADRFTFVPGDLQTASFGDGYDIATLGHILHSEGEVRSRALLQKTFDAMAPGGTIAIAEFLVDDTRTGPLGGLLFGVNMLVNTDEGDTFSFNEIGAWLRAAGFEEPRLVDVPAPSPLVLATKPSVRS